MEKQFTTDEKGKKLAVILPIDKYKKVVSALEDLEDIKLYDTAKKTKQEFIASDVAFEEIEKANS